MSAEVKLVALEVGDALWDSLKKVAKMSPLEIAKKSGQLYWDYSMWWGETLAGEFNTKATFGQILTDAVISMFPVLGEVTAVRDSIAITIRMCTEPGAAKDKWEWISLVCCLLALVPVFGGLLKGVGRLIVEAGKSSKKAVEVVEEILKFLNKMGVGDARKWLKELKILQYQNTVLNSFHELIGRIKATCAFLSTKMGAALPESFHAALRVFSEKLDELQKLGDRMIPEAFKEFHGQLKIIQEAMHDGSYVAPIRVGAKESRVMVPEGRILVEKTIQGSMQHPPASLANYTHKEGWPDLKKTGEGRLPDPVESKELRDQMVKAGDYWPINTFSRNAPIVAHVGKPGDPLVRILDKEVVPIRGGNGATAPKYKQDFHKAGDMWGDVLPPNGHWFRIKLAVKHAWNGNGYYEKLIIPTRAQMEALGIHVPHDWEGMKLWKGTVGGQLDNAEARNGFKATNDWLEGGGTQLYIDFSHPHNAPVKDYLLKTVQTFETGWKDLQLPMGKAAEHKVVNLEDLERSAKIQEEGYLLRGAATAGKQSNNPSQQKQ